MIIPIVFATDKNLVIQTGVCITSLLLNSEESDHYDIYIIVDKSVSDSLRLQLKQIVHFHKSKSASCSITFIEIENRFVNSYSISHITQATYYRLLIPELIPMYDRIFYSDVDIIFKEGLSSLYRNTNIDNYYLAASHCEVDHDYINAINCDPSSYFCAGFMFINSKKIKDDGLINEFLKHAENYKYDYLDQDVLNICCKNNVLLFPPFLYGFDQTIYQKIMNGEGILSFSYSEDELDSAFAKGLIHYSGKEKPWNYLCHRFDEWWMYYRLSIFYDENYCYEFYKKNSNGDFLDLRKRLRLLIRYFVTRSKLYPFFVKHCKTKSNIST